MSNAKPVKEKTSIKNNSTIKVKPEEQCHSKSSTRSPKELKSNLQNCPTTVDNVQWTLSTAIQTAIVRIAIPPVTIHICS